MSRSTAWAFAFSAIVGVGCAAESVPPTASEDTLDTSTSEAVSAATPTATAAATPHDPSLPCKPGTPRVCRRTWLDHGISNCQDDVQYCRSDSRAWLECGAVYDGKLGAE